MLYYYLWVVIDLDCGPEMPKIDAVSDIQDIWDYGIAGDFVIARHTQDEIILCVERNPYEDFQAVIANQPGKWGDLSDELITYGIGGREMKANYGSIEADAVSPRLLSAFRKLLKSEIEDARKTKNDLWTHYEHDDNRLLECNPIFRVTIEAPRPGLPSPESLF